MKKYENALDDANAAGTSLQDTPGRQKAAMRKIKAMRGLGQYHGAGACAKMAIALDRRNIKVRRMGGNGCADHECAQAVNEFKVQIEECKLLDTLSKAKEKDSGWLRDLAFAVEALGRPQIAQDPNALKSVSAVWV